MIEQLNQAAQQPPQQESDGKELLEQQKLQMEQMKVSQDGQIAQMENQTKMQIAQTNAQVKVMDTQVRANSEAERNAAMIRKNELDILANRR